MSATNQFDPANIRAMIVDDHDPIRKAMKRVLVGLGIKNIVECFDGSGAIKVLHEQPIDIILLDIYMRKTDGFKVLETVRNRSIRFDIPTIIVTGESTKESIVKASDLGADDYILKPFQIDSMSAKVQQVLNNFFSPPPLLSALRKGDRLVLSKDFKGADIAYREALAIDKTSIRAKHSIALVSDYRGDNTEALKQLEKNIKEAPSYYKSFQALANIHLRNKAYPQAIAALRKELELNPKQGPRQIQLAKILFKQGDIINALEHYKLAVKEDSKSKAALIGIGRCYATLDELEKAIHYFRRTRRHHHQDPSALKAIIKVALQAEKPKLAENALKEEKNLHPNRKDVYVQLGDFYLSQNRLDEAESIINDLLKTDPTNSDGLATKGKVLLRRKQFADALDIFLELGATIQSIELFSLQAQCMLPLGQVRDCVHALHQALAIKGRHRSIFFLLATAYKKSQQFAKAYLCFEQAIASGSSRKKCLPEMASCISNIKSRRTKKSDPQAPQS